MTYKQSIIKKNIELAIMSPIIWLGKLAGMAFPLQSKHNIFLFFPSADIGGSIKVNADITNCIKDKKPIIIFSKKPKNNEFKHLFNIEGVKIIDLHKYIDNKIFHFVNFFFRGVISSWINKVDNPVIFGGEGIFFYKIIPHVKKETKIIELCHLNTWLNYSQAFIKYIDIRLFSTPKIKRDVETQYKKNNIPEIYFERLIFKDNKIDIPPYQKNSNNILQVLFVGRGASQKRVHLIGQIADKLYEKKAPVHFSFVGDVEKIIGKKILNNCTVHGNIKDDNVLSKIYFDSDVLILTSKYEGLPLAIMEMMARGRVIISTAVDGIPDYIKHLENGLLIEETDETLIVKKGVSYIEKLISDSALREIIGLNSYQYAKKYFSGETFCSFYKEILING